MSARFGLSCSRSQCRQPRDDDRSGWKFERPKPAWMPLASARVRRSVIQGPLSRNLMAA